MAETMHTREVLTVLGLCILWYIVSSSNNVVGKMLLNDFPYPMTVTMVQLMSITAYSGPFFNMWGVRRFVDISWTYYFKLIVPLALGKFVASVFTHVSIWKVPVSYAHTVKATMPLFTVILSRIIIGEKQTCKLNTKMTFHIHNSLKGRRNNKNFTRTAILFDKGKDGNEYWRNSFLLHPRSLHNTIDLEDPSELNSPEKSLIENPKETPFSSQSQHSDPTSEYETTRITKKLKRLIEEINLD